MNFSEIIGQEDAKNLLKNAIKKGSTSHAYIFSGEKGSGKMMLAEAFAKMLQCENPGEDSCGECHSCKQAESHNNPDIIYVKREAGKANIGVDVVREQINNDIEIKPYSSKYKVYIVDEAERMNPQAQNALLKTIEEPPAYAIIILLTTNHNSFLQTILSRCVTIQMKTIDTELIKRTLQEKYHIVDYQSEMVASFAQGNLGKAIELASSDEFQEIKSKVVSIAKKAAKMDEAEISAEVSAIKDYNNQDKKDSDSKKSQGFIEQMLDLITLWFRDVLLYKATMDDSLLIFKEDTYDIHEQAENCSYNGLNNIFNSLTETRERLNANVNFELTIMLLILALKENLNDKGNRSTL
ncbi:MAG: DNA polymerase III subunit delta' [Pseudobutyrivibrio sp.]|nr:DNA polymerase III subunit delta' [Pseudobutyrivibrio sp.]